MLEEHDLDFTDQDRTTLWRACGSPWLPGMRGVCPGHKGWAYRLQVPGTGVDPWYCANTDGWDTRDLVPDWNDKLTCKAFEVLAEEAYLQTEEAEGNGVAFSFDGEGWEAYEIATSAVLTASYSCAVDAALELLKASQP